MKPVVLFAAVIGWAFAFSVSAAETPKPKEKILHVFCRQENCPDGLWPAASLIDVNGTLYSTTEQGGAYGAGTVFALDPKTGSQTVVHAFGNGADGAGLFGNLIDVKGTLYGTTADGGALGVGTVFSLDPKTGTETVLYSFGTSNNPDGFSPTSGLIDVKGTLYGTTLYGGGGVGACGGNDGCGTVFALDPKTGAEKVLLVFDDADGDNPAAGLIDVKGKLYGTTFQGGAGSSCAFKAGCGTVFALDPGTGAETVLYSFCSQPNCADGQLPAGALIAVKGVLYGTTLSGGANGQGAVFALDPKTGVQTVLYSFCARTNCTDGAQPASNLIDVNGTLYGTTQLGGGTGCDGAGCGTVFSLDVDTGKEKVLYAFCKQQNCADGWRPLAALLDVKGTFYGTTLNGGIPGGCDVVFALKP